MTDDPTQSQDTPEEEPAATPEGEVDDTEAAEDLPLEGEEAEDVKGGLRRRGNHSRAVNPY